MQTHSHFLSLCLNHITCKHQQIFCAFLRAFSQLRIERILWVLDTVQLVDGAVYHGSGVDMFMSEVVVESKLVFSPEIGSGRYILVFVVLLRLIHDESLKFIPDFVLFELP